MRWYWTIMNTNRSPDNFLADSVDLKGIGWRQLQEGKYVENWNLDARVDGTMPELNGDPGDVLLTDVPIFSARLQEIICKAGFSGIQFLPIHVFRADGSEIPGFAVANILNTPSALDVERTEMIRKVLKRDALEGYDIVRPKEFKSAIYVSDRFKSDFESANCIGYSFKEVELS
jgi:hypothetical protein